MLCVLCRIPVSREYSSFNASQVGTVDKINVHKRVDKIDKVLYNTISTCAIMLYRGVS